METIGSKRSYALTWCMPNNDDDDDVISSALVILYDLSCNYCNCDLTLSYNNSKINLIMT